ncbi:hypothetical protein EDL79_02575 [Ehrlichia ruminantium]|uniref:Uncharacterized protein n=2 Tax=Ehrlichia ruminantium TaxID=779 RepID=A0AAE6Q8Z0_EHRRU|nr:hypothetical protein [Ehrlichia ruminantium]QGR03444.1 hypothetical protein EDL80_02565 [Ehrlichia ruminantium]QGR04369.1 hypothetical protein EDL79_02575 [Ehrlichia ruminantium]
MQFRINNNISSVLTSINNLTLYTYTIYDIEKKYVWCNKCICIGMITPNNQASMVKTLNKPMLCTDKEAHYIFFIKATKLTGKVWMCVLVKNDQLTNFLQKLTLNNYRPTQTGVSITVATNINLFQSYTKIICSGEGNISFSKLKKRIKRECKNSNDQLLNTIEFPPNNTLFNRIINGITEILPMYDSSYSRIL